MITLPALRPTEPGDVAMSRARSRYSADCASGDRDLPRLAVSVLRSKKSRGPG
jgi:hypothetical protein